MERPSFVKLSDLVDNTFTVEKAGGYNFKMWDNENRKMLISDKYVQGYRKIYTFTTDKGVLDLSSSQVGALLEAVYQQGAADLNGKSFEVKSNGKTGMDIRYFFNPVKLDKKAEPEEEDDGLDDPIDLSDIPF